MTTPTTMTTRCLLFLLTVNVLTVLTVLPCPLQAELLCLSFEDPVGDSYGTIFDTDVTNLSFVIDTSTGTYYGQLVTDEDGPLVSGSWIIIDLYDVDRGPHVVSNFVRIQVQTTDADTPATSRVLFGSSSYLKTWLAGDRVSVDDSVFGSPYHSGGEFFSTVQLSKDGKGAWDYIARGRFGVLRPCNSLLLSTSFETGDLRMWSAVGE